METPKTSDTEIPKKIDRYDILGRIGAGGMGLILKGVDTRLKRQVAIKIISGRLTDKDVRATVRERFFNEARAAGGLSHPNLVQIYDFGESDDLAYIVMEYIEGETLENLIKVRGQLNLEEMLRVTKEVASALAFAHKKGIVHRDIKPSNIIIEAHSGNSKVLDFGIAKFVNEDEMKLTSTGMVLGSTHYLSPEHIIGKNLDGRSDIFCLGTVLYEASTGILPFRGSNSSNILYKIVHFDPQPLQELRQDLLPAFSSLVMKCLKKNPAERFQKCEDIEKEIGEIQANVTSAKFNMSQTGAHTSGSVLKSYLIRDSQILTMLSNQKRVDPEHLSDLKRRQNLVEHLLKESIISEDDLSKIIADCLDLPSIPRGRLKSLKVSDQALQLLPDDVLLECNILPFYLDEEKKQLSVLIDGCSDFQKNPKFAAISRQYGLRLYVGGKFAIQKIIYSRINQKEVDKTTNSRRGLFSITTAESAVVGITEQRVLLVDQNTHHQEALVKLFKKNENNLVIATDVNEARLKLKKESFSYVWVQRSLIGDELEFDLLVLKQNPNAEIRYFDQLAHEIFEESIPYRKFREFYQKLVQSYLGLGSEEARTISQAFAEIAGGIAESLSQNRRIIDEVYYATLLWKWESLNATKGKAVELFDGLFRLRYAFDCIGERFDGRGPLALKEKQIPLASRIIAALLPFESVQPTGSLPLSDAQQQDIKSRYQKYSGRQLDPQVVAYLLDRITVSNATEATAKIAIIDSDAQYSKNLAAQLSGISKETKIYPDGASALAGIKLDRPDLIISEVLLSKLDGFSLCARIQADEILRSIPLVFLSESAAPEHSTKAIQLGAADYIAKSSDPQFIIAKLERMLQSRRS